MSRPIFSRPRTRVYNCNYDKGESYYKPMMDHLDRKYSPRPLFSEGRSSLADEIAARRSDIGSRDLSGPRTFTRDPDLENDTPRTRNQAPTSLFGAGIHEDDEDTVYDIRGQRTHRRNLADDFASEVSETTRRFKAQAASISYDTEHYDDLKKIMQTRRQDIGEKVMESAKTAMEDAEAAFKRRAKFSGEAETDNNSFAKWSKLPDLEASAALRARQTKAKLADIENEIEEMAERQAKRDRRVAAIRALVNDSSIDDVQQTSEHISKKVTMKSEKMEKRGSVGGDILGSRHLTGTRGDEDNTDFLYEGYGRPVPEDEIEDDFVFLQRRFKQRASEAFEHDLAELRRRRRDLQDRLFDMIDVGAEIERAKSTLENANLAFQKHATKFNNNEEPEIEPENLVARLEKTRKLKEMAKQAELPDSDQSQSNNKKMPLFKWSKFVELENEMPQLVGNLTKERIKGELPQIPQVSAISTDIIKTKPKSERRKSKKKSIMKRKKSIEIQV